MAHGAQRVFVEMVKDVKPDHFAWKNVLEVGSLDINGTVRTFFEYCNYVGVDVGHGPGVDFAVQGQDLQYPDESFDVTISAECFEHNPFWRETWLNMVRMTKTGGLIIMTCAGTGRPEHGTTRSDAGSSPLTVALGQDYYRNLTPEDFDAELRKGIDVRFYENTVNRDLYAWAVKGGKGFDLDLASVPWV